MLKHTIRITTLRTGIFWEQVILAELLGRDGQYNH